MNSLDREPLKKKYLQPTNENLFCRAKLLKQTRNTLRTSREQSFLTAGVHSKCGPGTCKNKSFVLFSMNQ
jgi:hypothetical protein